MSLLPPLLQSDAETVLDRHRDLFAELRQAQIFLSGGTGFVGKWLTLTLVHANERLALGARLRILSRDPGRALRAVPWYASSGVDLVAGDIRSMDPDRLAGADHVIHAAAEVASQMQVAVETAGEGTRRLVDGVSVCQAQRFLLISSGVAHLAGGDAGKPMNAYHESKRLSEAICNSARQEGRIRHLTIARLFSMIGPFLPRGQGFAAADLLGDAIAGRTLCVLGDGTAVRSYLYAADMAAWLWTLLLRGADGAAVDVGSDQSIDIAGLARAIIREVSSPAPGIAILGRSAMGRAPACYVPDIAFARAACGLEAWTTLPAAIRKTLAYEANPSQSASA